MKRPFVVLILLFLVAVPTSSSAASDRGADEPSWKLPLQLKEKMLEENNVAHHNILGLYPSQVELPLDGSPVDISTRGYCNIAHAVCWTANYLMGASYRFAFLKDSGAPAEEVGQAQARADELFEALYRCQLVTGVRGLQSRGYALGHGESYEEREGHRSSNAWYQGAGAYKDLRWRGSPSHHNYSDATAGLCAYYDLAAEGVQRERCREAIDALVGYWVDNDLNIRHFDSRKYTPILGLHDGKTLNMRIMMAIAGAKTAHHATGDPKYLAMYERLIDQFGLRTLHSLSTEKDFDDAEHVFCHLENLFRIEKDPELLAAYGVVADALWANHKDDGQTLFTYIYFSLRPDAPHREKALREGLYALQTWPTDMLIRPTMSSLHPELKPPYPVYAAAWDNEYIWKGHLLNPDGWLSRTVLGVAVAQEDDQVIYAFDTKGDLYQSRDGAATAAQWHCINPVYPARVRAVAAGPRSRMIYTACADGFYASMTGGEGWQQLSVPEMGGAAVDVQVVHDENITVYAIREKAVYASSFKRERDLDRHWLLAEKPEEAASGALQFRADPAGVMKSTDGGANWELKTQGLDIARSDTVFTPKHSNLIFAGTPAGLYISKDEGESWEPGHLVLQFTKNSRRDLGGAAYIDAYWRGRYYGFISDDETMTPMP
ncbi:MAG: hypothetical protein WCX86_09180 [Candidatus Hydrogenedentales bacterium]|jgi:hypothetical protein